jgi:hypothetical protein
LYAAIAERQNAFPATEQLLRFFYLAEGSMFQNVALERCVLACLWQFGDCIGDGLDETCFSRPENRTHYRVLMKALETATRVDCVGFLAAAEALGLADHYAKRSELEYLRAMDTTPVYRENAPGYAAQLKQINKMSAVGPAVINAIKGGDFAAAGDLLQKAGIQSLITTQPANEQASEPVERKQQVFRDGDGLIVHQETT